jgi:hypothetical protein
MLTYHPIPGNIKSIFGVISVFVLCFFIGCDSPKTKKDSEHTDEMSRYANGELALQHGMELFNQHCASCHSFIENEIGPNLNGITSEVDKEWLKVFIKDPEGTVKSGDERAVALFEKYNLYMPSFAMLNDQDLEDLLGFIHKFSEAEKKSQSNRPGALLNPITEKIPESDLTLIIEELVTVPPSSESNPKTRINTMLAVKSGQGERLFIADLRGKLYEIADTTVREYLDLKSYFENFIDNPGRASGLGSFAFHPEFDKNGLFYITHTEPPKTSIADFPIHDSIPTALQWVLTEWKAHDPLANKFIGEKREVLRADMVGAAHGFQELSFNPLAKYGDDDYGLLYVGIGDGSAALAGYPSLCDTVSKIWGSILRIDPTGRNSGNGKYGIPKENPYANDSSGLGEIWCNGFRNPHRISWDESGSGKMFISNIGQHSVEEVNLGKKGANYGWPNREGTFLFDVNANTEVVYPLPSDDSGYTYPVIQYDHDEGNAVSGGFAYSGSNIPLLKDKYIFGDIPRGTLYYSPVSEIIEGKQAPIYKMGLQLDGKETSLAAISTDVRVDLRFGKDSSGELYIFTKSDGKVYKVIDCRTANTELPSPAVSK